MTKRVYEDILRFPINANMDLVYALIGAYLNFAKIKSALPTLVPDESELARKLSPISEDIPKINAEMGAFIQRMMGFDQMRTLKGLRAIVLGTNTQTNHVVRIDIVKDNEYENNLSLPQLL